VDEAFAGQAWTAAADLNGSTTTIDAALALARTAGAVAAEPVVKGPAVVRAGDHDTDAMLIGLPAAPELQRPHLIAGRMPGAGQILLSEQTAATLRVRTGLRVRVIAPEGERELTVSGIARTLAPRQAYTGYADAAALLAMPGQANSMYLAAPPAAVRRLSTEPGIARVTTLAAARAGMHDLVRELTGLIHVLLAISLAVGALFLASSLALSLLDRQGEFATLRALGFGRSRIAAVFATEAVTQSVLAGALAVPAGLLIAWPLTARIGQAWFRIGIHPRPSDFTLVIALTLAIAILAALQATRRVQRLDIAAAVRARLIG
jgi:putative ABC transport system permease protein